MTTWSDEDGDNISEDSQQNMKMFNRQIVYRTLRQPLFKWLVVSFDLKTQKVISQNIKTRSPAWVVFQKSEQNKLESKCRVCRSICRAKFGNTTQLLRHMQNQHFGLKHELQKIFENRKSNATYQLINLIQMTGMQSNKKYLGNHFAQEHQEQVKIRCLSKDIEAEDPNYKKIIFRSKSCKQIQKQLDYEAHCTQILKQFKINPDHNIFEIYEHEEIACAIFSTKNMQRLCCRYQKILVFWYIPFPTCSEQLKSVIYIFGQDQTASPVILSVILIFVQELQPIKFINHLFLQNSLFSTLPEKLIIDGPQWLIAGFEQFNSSIQNLEKCKYGCSIPLIIYLEGIFDFKSNKQFKNYLLDRKAIDLSLECADPFVGFILSGTFISKVDKLITHRKQKLYNLQDFLNNLIKTNAKYTKYCNVVPFSQSSKDQSLFQCVPTLKYAINVHQIAQLMQKLSTQIFLKLCYSFLYMKSSLTCSQKISMNTNQIYQINNSYIWGSQNHVKVYFSESSKQWKCSCITLRITGLPCPHLLYVLIQKKISLRNYVHPLWIIDYRPIQAQFEGKQQRKNVQIIQIESKALDKSIELDIKVQQFEFQRYKLLFWGDIN